MVGQLQSDNYRGKCHSCTAFHSTVHSTLKKILITHSSTCSLALTLQSQVGPKNLIKIGMFRIIACNLCLFLKDAHVFCIGKKGRLKYQNVCRSLLNGAFIEKQTMSCNFYKKRNIKIQGQQDRIFFKLWCASKMVSALSLKDRGYRNESTNQ